MKLNPHLVFNGDCEAAFKFYEKSLGGRIGLMMPHQGTPVANAVPESWRSKILHATLLIGDQVLMGADAPPGHYATPQGFFVSLPIEFMLRRRAVGLGRSFSAQTTAAKPGTSLERRPGNQPPQPVRPKATATSSLTMRLPKPASR